MPAARRYKYTCISRERERERVSRSKFIVWKKSKFCTTKKQTKKHILQKTKTRTQIFWNFPNPTNCWVEAQANKCISCPNGGLFLFWKKKTPPFLNIFSQMICFLVVSYFTVYYYKNQPHFNQMLDSLYVHFTWSFSFIEKHHVVIWSVEAIRASKEPIALRLLTSIQHDTSWGVFCQKLRKLLDNHDL